VVQLVKFDLGDDGTVVAEVDDTEPGVDRAARGADQLKTAAATLSQVRGVAVAAVQQFRDVEHPDEIEIEFGIRLTVTAGAVLAKSSIDGHIQVRIAWKRPVPDKALPQREETKPTEPPNAP
jgi:hypothetical protein